MSFWDTLLGTAGGYWASERDYSRIGDISGEAAAFNRDIANNIRSGSTFTPSTITPGASVGGTNLPSFPMPSMPTVPTNQYVPGAAPSWLAGMGAPSGTASYTQGQIANGLLGGMTSLGALGQLGVGTGRTEQELYNMMEGMQTGGRERDRLALRDELAAQGRLGVGTAAYGGTPEELARQIAVEEARGANSMRAFQLAGEEQGRLAQQRLAAMGLGEQSAARQDQSLLQSFGLANQSQETATNLANVLGRLSLEGYGIQEQAGQEAARLGLQDYLNQSNFYTNMGALGNEAYKNSFLGDQLAYNYAQLSSQEALGRQNNRLISEQIAANAEMNAANIQAQSAYQQAMIESAQDQNLVNLILGTVNNQTGANDGNGLISSLIGLLGGS